MSSKHLHCYIKESSEQQKLKFYELSGKHIPMLKLENQKVFCMFQEKSDTYSAANAPVGEGSKCRQRRKTSNQVQQG